MAFYRLSALALLSLRVLGAVAQKDAAAETALPPNLAVSVTASFPQAEVFGVKLVNGHTNKAIVEIKNNEAEPVNVAVIGGTLSAMKVLPEGVHPSTAILRNLTATKYGLSIPAGASETLPYTFTTDMQPQDLRLQIVAVVASNAGVVYQIQAYNETVSVVEAPTSFLDPQIIFLYVVLSAAFIGTLYFIYKTWIQTLFPKTKTGKGGERARRSVGGKNVPSPEDRHEVSGADGPAATSASIASKGYDESWIPEGHLNRPTARRVKSSASKTKTRIVD